MNAQDASDALIARARERQRDPTFVWGIPYGFPGIDRATGGIHPGELGILVGMPGVGKSAITGQIVQNVAGYLQSEGKGRVVKVASLEMSPEAWQHRMICARANVNSERIKTGYANAEQLKRYEQAAREVARLPIEYLPGVENFRELATWIKQGSPAYWVIDHLGLIPVQTSADTTLAAALIKASGWLRVLAKEHVPGLVLSQMNKGFEGRSDKRPTQADVYGGMLVAANAELVMGLYREDLHVRLSDEAKGKPVNAEVLFLKNREGGLATVDFMFAPTLPMWIDKTEALDKLADKLRREA
jgi:replicative DNA helicase